MAACHHSLAFAGRECQELAEVWGEIIGSNLRDSTLTFVIGDSPINTPWMGFKRLFHPGRAKKIEVAV